MPKPTEEPSRRTRAGQWFAIAVGGLTGRWRRFEIADHSMRPTLRDGDWTLGIARPRRVDVGDIVVCNLPDRDDFSIVKRIAAIDSSDGSLWLTGDDATAGSVDSRSFGSIPFEAITARLALRYRPLPPTLLR